MHTRTPADAKCPLRQCTDEYAHVAISPDMCGFYSESIVCNHTGEDISYLNAAGEHHRLPHTPGGSHIAKKFVSIIHRRVRGSRAFVKGKYQGHAWKDELEIDADTLRDGPIFIQEMSIVIGSYRHHGAMVNPASALYRESLIRNLYERLGKEIVRSPISICANDPEGRFPYIYTIVNDQIVGVKVSNYKGGGETDGIVLIRRDSTCLVGENEVRVTQTTFADLLRIEDRTWIVDGYRITPDRHRLEAWLALQHEKPKGEVILLSDHRQIVAEKDAVWLKTRTELTENYEARLKQMAEERKKLESGHKSELATLKRLHQEELSQRAQETARLNSETDHLKAKTARVMLEKEELAAMRKERHTKFTQIITGIIAAISLVSTVISNWKHIAPVIRVIFKTA